LNRTKVWDVYSSSLFLEQIAPVRIGLACNKRQSARRKARGAWCKARGARRVAYIELETTNVLFNSDLNINLN